MTKAALIPIRQVELRTEQIGDCPEVGEIPQLLFTLAYSELIEAIADVLFPPNEITAADGSRILVKASQLRPDRHIHFRAVWQPEFGQRLQLALRDLTDASLQAYSSRHFSALSQAEQTSLVTDLQKSALGATVWRSLRGQAETFNCIHDALSAGLFADPGYGGNSNGMGWVYAQFQSLGE